MSTTTTQPDSIRPTQVLLACGIAYPVLYVVINDIVAAFLYPGYDPVSQAISDCPRLARQRRPFSSASRPSGRYCG